MRGDERDSGARNRQVLIVQTYVPQYRVAFFQGLKTRLAAENVHLDLIYSDPPGDADMKSDAVILPWAIYLKNKHIGVGQHKLRYQPVARRARHYDLVIVEQANKLLVNPLLAMMNGLGLIRLAYWGHGKDFQGCDGFLARSYKRALLPHVHWWFAYNELSASVVQEAGFPDERITRVMNTIDNEELERTLASIAPNELEHQREKLGLHGKNVCIYVGGMYDKKRIGFLLAACELVRQQTHDFEIVFLGGGVDWPLIEDFAAKHDWAIACGPTFDREKAINLKLAKLLLMPGLVGLAIIDALTAQTPIVTTNVSYHSPEIDYLVDGVNGEIVQSADSVEDYAGRVTALLGDEKRLAALRGGCEKTAKELTMTAMIDRYCAGILSALE